MRYAVILALALLVPVTLSAEAQKPALTGDYLEARTCDVWTGPCFANAETSMAGKQAVMAWRIDKGTYEGAKLDGLGVVAVIVASDTLGTEQTSKGKAILIVDKRADSKQKDALVKLAKKQAGVLVKNIVAIESADVDLQRCPCKNDSCATLKAGSAKIETKCLSDDHKICGNESEYYPPLSENVKAKAALTSETSYTGDSFGETWKLRNRRSAFVGTFSVK